MTRMSFAFSTEKNPALVAHRFGDAAERARENETRLIGRGPQGGREGLRRLPRRQQFRQADPVRARTACQRVNETPKRRRRRRSAGKQPTHEGGPSIRCGRISRGTIAALTSDDFPEPLAPETSKKAVPSRARAARASMPRATSASPRINR